MTTGKVTAKEGRSLLEWLAAKYPDTPRKRAKQWIQAGRVRVNGTIIRQPHQVFPDPGEGLDLLDRQMSALDCGTGWQIHPRVILLYLDSVLAVVNKGPGLISVPAPYSEISALSILADFLSGKLRVKDRKIAGKSLPPPYRHLQPLPVHRLDQYTSGVFCLALTPAARQQLIDQVKLHAMRREYVAFVEGRSKSPRGTWRHWLKLSEDQTRQRVISAAEAKASPAEATEAITHFEVMAEYPLASHRGLVTQLRLRLETGLKHQIRVQAAQAGLPLLGDRTYHPNYRALSPARPVIDFPRQALHAASLTLEHPEQTGKWMTWQAALPKDLRQLEADLKSKKF